MPRSNKNNQATDSVAHSPHGRSRRLPLALALLALTGLANVAGADDCPLTISVVDPKGEPVPGALVTQVGGASVTASAEGGACLPAFPREEGGALVVTADGWTAATSTIATGESQVQVVVQPAFGEELVVTATGDARRLKDVPVHIEAIDRSEIVASAARTLADAVEYTSGLRLENNCGNCNTTQLRMLGLEGPYSQIVVDGQPTVSSLALVYGLEQIPARMLDGIEVLKGSGSALYGASSIAGTINLIPHAPDHTHVEVDLETNAIEGMQTEEGNALRALLDWGSDDRRRSASFYSQRDEVPLVDVDGDGFSEVTQRELKAFGFRGQRIALDDSAQLVGDLNWTDASRRGGDIVNFDRPPDQTAVTEAIDTQTLAASIRWLHTLNSRTDYRIALSRVELDRDSYYGAGFDPDAYGVSSGTTTVFSAQVHHGHDRGTLSWGVQADRDEITDVQLGYDRLTEETNESWSIFAQEDRKLGKKVSLLYGARFDNHSAIEDPIVSPRAAILYSPRDDVTLRATYGHGFRPPVTFDEDLHIELVGGGTARVIRPSEDLQEESSRSALLSAEWRPVLGRRTNASFEFVAFDTRLDDLFFNQEVDDPSTPELELLRVNLSGARVRGVEATASLRFGSTLQIDAGFVVQSARFDDPEPDFGSRDFWRTPERYGNLSIRWSATPRLELFGGALYTGAMLAPHFAGFIDTDRLEETPSFLTFDANASYRWALEDEREILITVGGKNLTDEYQPDLDRGPDRDSSYVYGPRFPRQWFLSLGLRF